MMDRKANILRRFFRPTALLLAVSFILAPVTPVFAQETSLPPVDTLTPPPSEQPPTEPTTTPSETPETPEVPATPPAETIEEPPTEPEQPPAEEAPAEEPKPEEPIPPEPESLSAVGPLSLWGSISENRVSRLTPEIDNTTGALVYKYNIVVPPGRGRMTPQASLVYNSVNANKDSIIGSGWEIDIPYIERINKKGSDKLYTENYFAASFDGELVLISGSAYGAKDENDKFFKYDFSNNTWTVTDKDGVVYKFGSSSGARQDNPQDSTKVFKWMLEEIRDTNDNFISYEYFKDAGQIYPSRIVYTGNGATPGVLEVNFERESRPTALEYFNTGFSVTSSYRISEVRTEVNNVWARKYTLSYTAADNGSSTLLNTIVESGQDDSQVVTTLPAIDFSYNTAATDWTYNSLWDLPVDFINGLIDFGLRYADINGDGLIDLLCHNARSGQYACKETEPKIWLNSGAGWTDVSSTWLFPPIPPTPNVTERFTGTNSEDLGLRTIDVNGDQRTDLVRSDQGVGNFVYINNGSGWTYDSTWNLTMTFVHGGADRGLRMADINGDELPDLLCHNKVNMSGPCTRNDPEIWINTGTGWVNADATWQLPLEGGTGPYAVSFLGSEYEDTGLRLIDVNGDRLTDLVETSAQPMPLTYINNGSGWTLQQPNWEFPMSFAGDTGARMSDINGDTLIDFLCHNDSTSGLCPVSSPIIELHRGNKDWTSALDIWAFPPKVDAPAQSEIFLDDDLNDAGRRLFDVNGDGLDDIVRAFEGSRYTYLNNEDVATNLLTEIVHPQGGSTTITYKATPQLKDGSNNLLNPSLPILLYVVTQISNSDGLGTTETYNYEYEGGKYYFNTNIDRKFAGFNKVTKTNAAGHKTINYFHQGDTTDSSNGEFDDHVSKIGKPYRTEVKDSSGNLYSLTVTKWDRFDLGSGRSFVKNIRSTELTYDSDADHKDKAEEYTYENTYGNLTQKIEWGEVTASGDGSFTDTGNDKFTTTITYASNVSAYIVGLLKQETKVNQGSNKQYENKFYYDNLALGSVTDGNLTKHEMWKTGSNYADIERTYNATYGLMTQEKDPRDKATNYVYDTYNLFPATVTNPLSQVMSYTYDYSSGQVKQKTDPNTRVFETVYDGLDRVKEEKQPDLTTPLTLITKASYVYTDTSGAVKVQRTDHLDGSTSGVTHTYYDGLNRPIQVRRETEDTNFAITDTLYNNLGQVHKESVLYLSAGSAKTAPTTDPNFLITYSHDPKLRITSIVNAIGTTSNIYDDWKQIVTDPRGKTKDLTRDAYGNLTKVEEHNSTNTYTTTYTYNGNKKLTKITDAAGNIRNFTYDGLERPLTAQDLHASSDSTFGTWTYTYDNSDNLITVLDPKGQTINYTYDDINRLLTEDFTGQAGTEVTYTYDSGTDGKGRLTSVTSAVANSSYVYNPLGGIKQETKTVDSINYQTDYTYDRQGNVLEITNPDSSKVKYTYNTAGQLETIQRKELSDGGFINLVTDFDYGPHSKVTYQALANGAATTNTYDATKLYRLSNRTSTIPGGSKVQDLTYTYDVNNNITKIVDASNTNTSRTVDYTYDDLNRLTSAVATNVASGQSAYSHSYTYSSIGNILTRTDSAGTYSYTGHQGASYANPHAVTSIGSNTYTYDNNGNMLTETGGLSNTWDYNNRLTQAVKGAVTSTYAYDHTGQRVKLSNGTTTTRYPSKQYNTDGTLKTKHIFAGEELVASIETGGSGAVPGDTGWKTTGTVEVSTGWNSFTTTRINTSDNNRATCNTTCDDNDNAQTSDYSFGIPTNATITGIEVSIEANESAGADNIPLHVSLSWNDGVSFTTAKIATIDGTGDVVYVLGGSADTWGRTWDDAEFANGVFRARFDKQPTADNLNIDHIQIKVYYTTIGGAAVHYLHTDHLGGMNVSTSNSGAQEELMDYFPFGNIRIDQGGTSNEQRKYIGQEYDPDTALSYLNARYYDSSRGQFISQDPVFWEVGQTEDGIAVLPNPQALNSYAYSNNNPITNKDPQGRCVGPVVAICGAALVGAVGGVGFQVFSDYVSGDFNERSFRENLATYGMAATQGAVIGAGTAVAAITAPAVGLGAGATVVAVGGTAGVLTLGATVISNKVLGEPTNPTTAALGAGVAALTAGGLRSLPQVPGRLPNFGSQAFYKGAHTKRQAAEELLSSSAQIFAQTVSRFNPSRNHSTHIQSRTSYSSSVTTKLKSFSRSLSAFIKSLRSRYR